MEDIVDYVAETVPALPFEQPVIILAIALTSFFVAPILIERIGLPGIVGVVLAGTALGPNGLGILARSEAIVLLGNAGLVYLLFTVGLELDLRRFLNAPQDAAFFGVVSFSLPFVVGTLVGLQLLGLELLPALLLSAVFATHTLLAYPVVNKLNVTRVPSVTAVFGGILFTDTIGLIILALVMGASEQGSVTVWLVAEVAGALVVLFGGLWLVVPRVARWFFRNTSQESYFEFLFVAALIFAAASLAEGLGLAAILGAFVAGIALSRQVMRGSTLMNRIEFFGNAFFIPFFLFHVGMLVDPAVVLEGVETLWIATVILCVMFSTKVAAAVGVGAVKGYSKNEVGVLVGLSVGQAAAALAITLLGFEAGLFDESILNAVVVMILVSAVVSPWVTERYGVRLATESESTAEPSGPYDPRVLLPLSRNTEFQRRLLELAIAFKGQAASPVHLLTVLGPHSDEDEIAAVETALLETAEIGASAEVPVEVETRVNHNVASGIANAAVETRSDLIVLGWEKEKSLSGRVFGNTIEQVRRQTTDPVMVSRIGRPLNTTNRLLLVLPPDSGYHQGFPESIYLLNRLAENLGIGVEAVIVGNRPTPEEYSKRIARIESDMNAQITAVENWAALRDYLNSAEAADLVVSLQVREGGVGWSPQLRRLPADIVAAPPESFIVITPRQGEPGYPARFLRLE